MLKRVIAFITKKHTLFWVVFLIGLNLLLLVGCIYLGNTTKLLYSTVERNSRNIERWVILNYKFGYRMVPIKEDATLAAKRAANVRAMEEELGIKDEELGKAELSCGKQGR